ncbi:copper transporter 1-like [Diospyros lotus]|uniref:copper transporter 1-like n=1 Tax=Diospyros lotus TaxID=55363 RepID=UPI002253C6D8|nr:copper transporter 1-like [Diospyros lotus]
MEEMDHGHMNGTGGMDHKTGDHHKMMMHMTFFWGKNAEILFSGWPGTDGGMYALALLVVFLLSFLVEWLAHWSFGKEGSNRVAVGVARTAVHAARVALAYIIMLAVMSFNVGVLLAAVAGHALGFFLFGSRVFRETPAAEKESDVSPMIC